MVGFVTRLQDSYLGLWCINELDRNVFRGNLLCC